MLGESHSMVVVPVGSSVPSRSTASVIALWKLPTCSAALLIEGRSTLLTACIHPFQEFTNDPQAFLVLLVVRDTTKKEGIDAYVHRVTVECGIP